jgi:hypothetical protein
MYDPLNVLLNLVYLYFIENFCIYVHQRNWSFFFVLVVCPYHHHILTTTNGQEETLGGGEHVYGIDCGEVSQVYAYFQTH